MEIDLRWWLLIASNVLLFWLQHMINDVFGPLGIHLSLDVLYLIMPAICLRQGWGILLVFITGLLVDAGLPVTFGFHAVLFAVALSILHCYQFQLSRAGIGQLILVALGFNLCFTLIESLLLGGALLSSGAYWLRVASDLFFSSIAIGLIGWWFFSWERWLLYIVGSSATAPEKA